MNVLKGGPFDAKCHVGVGRVAFLVRHSPNKLRIGPWFVERAEFTEAKWREETVAKREILLRCASYKMARARMLGDAMRELDEQSRAASARGCVPDGN